MNTTARAELGHNNPPEPTLIEVLTGKNKELLDRMAEAMDAAKSAPGDILDDDTQNKVAETVKILRGCEIAFDNERKKEKEPFVQGGKQVDGFFNTKIDLLAKAREPLARKSDAYLKKKQDDERARIEKAAREKREAEEAAMRRAKDAQDAEMDAKRAREESDKVASEAAAAKQAATTEQEEAAADLATAKAKLANIRADIAATKAEYKVAERDGTPIDEADRENKRTQAGEDLETAKKDVSDAENHLSAVREKVRVAKEEAKKREDEAAAARRIEREASAETKGHLNEAVRHSSQAEKLEKKADGKPADLARTLSEHGAVSTLGQSWKWEVTDRSKLNKEALWPHINEEALRVALGKWMHAQPPEKRKMDGAYMEQETSGQIR